MSENTRPMTTDELIAEIKALKSVMMAAAVEITEHWDAHCDDEGYGPANLVRRLENGYPSQYGYDAQTVIRLEQRNAELESQMQGLSNDINDFQNIIERQKREIHELQCKQDTPLAFYEISHDEYGDVEYEFSVYPRPGFRPLYTQAIGKESK